MFLPCFLKMGQQYFKTKFKNVLSFYLIFFTLFIKQNMSLP